MIIKKLLFAVLLLALVYLPAFMFISFLMINSPEFATKAKAIPWLPFPIVMGVALVMAFIVISVLSKFNFSIYGFKLSGNLMISKAIIYGLVIGGVLSSIGSLVPSEELTFGSPSFLQTVLIFWILASLTEEIIFRGLIQTYLSFHIGGSLSLFGLQLSTAGLISAILFGLVHLALLSQGATVGKAITIAIGAFVLGVLAGYFRNRTGSLVAPVIIHSLFNISGYLIGTAV
jgi:uncharacterized protein